MKQPIKPKIPERIFEKPDPYLPKVEYLPATKKQKVISDFQMFLIELKRWVEKLTKETARIGFDSLFSKFSVAVWSIVILFMIYILINIFGR